ncbi:MAG: amidohydrolase [Synergistaceae bacterium]|nr:amidohydrolase [Synergistaceae bacterium]
MACEERKDSIALINGIIYPMASHGRSNAMFAKGGIIKALGSDSEILSMCDSRTTVLDMKGKFLMPGFTDTHNHLLATGRSLETLNLRGVTSIEEIVNKGREFLAQTTIGDGGWFFARGWDQNYLAEKRFPNRYDLDRITKDIPLLFERSCGHIAALNSKALEVMHIGSGFKISGGVVNCNENGEPNGVVSEAALNWLRMNIPEYSDETLERWYKRAACEMLKLGITAVQTDDLEMAGSTDRVFKLYEQMEDNDMMPLRISEQWHLRDISELNSFIGSGCHKRNGPDYFKSGPLKIHVDGTLGARTAALREEYSDDPGNRGIYAHSQSELYELLQTAQSAGMQVAFYAIGDGAIERCLNVIESVKGYSSGSDIAHRIVHCQVGAQDLYRRMANLGVMADIQPAFVTSDWPIVISRLGAERARWSYAWKSLILFGIPLGAGSDAPAEPLDPFVGIRAAILRQDEDNKPQYGWMPSQRLDRVEALSLYTSGGATVCGEGEMRGTLEVGKAADIVAFMEDPFMVTEPELLKMTVGLSVVDGKIRYIR